MLPHPASLLFLFFLKKVLLLILWRIIRVNILDLSIHVLNQTDAVEEEKKSCNEKQRGSRWKLEKIEISMSAVGVAKIYPEEIKFLLK